MANPTVIPMPAHGDHTVPIFDQSKPNELVWFFDKLEYLFDRAVITSDTEKKKQLL